MRIISLAVIGLCLTACGKPAEQKAPAPSEVFVSEVSEQPYHPSVGFNARIESRNDVNITAQISGELIAIHFTEGDQVTKGDALFDIDSKPYEAALARQQAELSKAIANEHIAKKNYERGKTLVKDGFISASEFDSLEAKSLESEAQTQSAHAAVDSAKVDLSYTKIFALHTGKIGRSAPALGDIVTPQYGTLTTLVGEGNMEVVFQIPERLLLSARSDNIKPEDIAVIVTMPDGSEHPELGVIKFFSNRVDTATGTAEVRATIANDNDTLRPGMFVRARLQLKQPLSALMIQQAAVQVDQQGSYVLVVDGDNKVTRKNVTLGERIQENVVVMTGVGAGEQVIVRGVQKARPGATVTPLEYKSATQPQEGQ